LARFLRDFDVQFLRDIVQRLVGFLFFLEGLREKSCGVIFS
jgi:hypothetical protein